MSLSKLFNRYLPLTLALLTLVAGGIFYLVSTSKQEATAAWYSSSWGYRKAITVDHNKVATSTSLSNFPMLFSVTDTDLKYTSYGGKVGKTDGTDILFTSSNGSTKLDHEIEKYSSSTGETIIWVEIPTLSGAEDTTIYIYFGNSGASDQQNITGVWDSNYKLVAHLPNGTTLTALDSTSNDNDGTNSGTVTADIGKVDGGALFNSNTEYINFGTGSSINNLSVPLTFSGWFNSDTSTGNRSILGRYEFYDSHKLAFLARIDLGVLNVYLSTAAGGYQQFAYSGNPSVNSWHHYTVVVSGSAASPSLAITIDGSKQTFAPAALSTSLVTTAQTRLGESHVGFSEGFSGILDEPRISDIVRSDAWIQTEYNNQRSPNTFYAYGKTEVERVTTLTNYTSSSALSWYSPSWTYRKAITVDHNKVATSTSLSNFPMLFSVTDTDLKYTSYGGKVGKTDGTDILFTSSNGTTKLDHEIEKYSSSTGEAIIWVEIPSLSGAEDTTIYIYFGNSGASDQQNITGVWNSNYRGVWHSSTTTGVTLKDSTSNALDGSKLSSTEPNPINGYVDGAQDYDGIDDYVAISDTNNPTAYTISAWVKKDSLDSESIFVRTDSSGPSTAWSHQLRFDTSGSFFQNYLYDGSFRSVTATRPYKLGTWVYLVGTAQNNGSMRLYINGLEEGTSVVIGTMWAGGDRWRIGQQSGSGMGWWDGIIDEVRVSTSVHTEGWIRTEYNNQSSPGTFYSYGGQYGVQNRSNAGVEIKSSGVAGPSWYSSSWGYRKAITVDHTKVATSSSLSNFPMLFSVTDTDLKYTSHGGKVASSTGADILFTSSNGTTKLDHEIEKYSSSTGETIIWVEIPTLSGADDTTIYIYFGNSGASDQQNITGVWDSNYKGVWHLEDGDSTTTDFYKDATSNAHNGTLTDSDGDIEVGSVSKIDGNLSFKGDTGDTINLGDTTALTLANEFTISGWARPETFTAGRALIWKESEYGIRINTTSQIRIIAGATTHNVTFNSSANIWYFFVGVWDGSNIRLYVNGVETGSPTAKTGAISDTANNANISNRAIGDLPFHGHLDEIRMSSSTRSAGWIQTEYSNQSSPNNFYSYGSLSTSSRQNSSGSSAPAIKTRGGVKFR